MRVGAVQKADRGGAGDVAKLAAFEGSSETFLRELVAAAASLLGATEVAAFRIADSGGAQLLAAYPVMTPAIVARPWMRTAAALAAEGGVEAPTARSTGDGSVVVVPTPTAERLHLAIFQETTDPAAVEASVQRAGWLVPPVMLYEQRRRASATQSSAAAVAGAMTLVDAVNAHARFGPAAMALCNEVASRFSAERVSLGVLDGRYVKLKAISGAEHFVRKTQVVQDIESAMEECLDQDAEVLFPRSPDADVVSRQAQQLSLRHGPVVVASVPLRYEGEAVAVLCVERPAGRDWETQELETLRLACDLLSPRLHELQLRGRWVGRRAADGARRGLAVALGPKHTWAKLLAIALFAALMFVLIAQGTYRVEAPFTVQVVRRQLMTAPFDGYLAEAPVEVGDTVSAGDALAVLDTTDLQLELASLEAERAGYLKEQDLARREQEIARAQMAGAQADRASARIDLLRHQVDQATLRSPVDGVVLEGDLTRRVGGAVQRGEVLLEVAPVDALRAELRVPASDIADVWAGQAGQVAAASHPTTYLPVVVERIEPMAEVAQTQNLFRVRATLEGTPPWLRPGVEGVARLDVGRRPYLWIWTRDAVNYIRSWLWI